MKNLNLVKQLLIPFDLSHEKVRIGTRNDGGYIISKTFLDQHTDCVYSLGIGNDCEFDVDLANRGYKIYQYDGTVPYTPRLHENFTFKSIMINKETLTQEIVNNGHEHSDILLKMDIEGGEFDVLLNLDFSILNRFSQIVFELHGILDNTNVIPLLEKMNCYFVLIHLHANNNINEKKEQSLPNVLELTFVKKDLALKIQSERCPVPNLDNPNFPNWPEITLDWWLKDR